MFFAVKKANKDFKIRTQHIFINFGYKNGRANYTARYTYKDAEDYYIKQKLTALEFTTKVETQFWD